MTTNGYIVQIENLISGYGKKIILNGISVNIEQGKITALIGRNGVGKTTLLNTFMGILKPESGRITYRGEDISATQIYYVPDKEDIDNELRRLFTREQAFIKGK